MRPIEKLFRVVVVASALVYVVLWSLPYFDWQLHSDAEFELLQLNGHGSVLPFPPALNWFLCLAWLLTAVGLFFFNPFARAAFVVLVLVSGVADFFWGFVVQSSWESGLLNITTLLDGATLAMAYLTPVSERFRA
jgi:hypothetical protein